MDTDEPKPPKKQATKVQRRERVQFCVDMLLKPVLKDGTILTHHKMASICGQKFGISVRQGWTYLKRASEICDAKQAPGQRMRGEWVSRCLESVIAGADEETRDKLAAIALYMKRNGLEAPQKNANTNSAGDDLPPVRTAEQDRAEFIKLLQQVKSTGGE